MKQRISFLLAFVLILVCFTACGNNETADDSESIATKAPDITIELPDGLPDGYERIHV